MEKHYSNLQAVTCVRLAIGNLLRDFAWAKLTSASRGADASSRRAQPAGSDGQRRRSLEQKSRVGGSRGGDQQRRGRPRQDLELEIGKASLFHGLELDGRHQLVQALVDGYNEEHSLMEDLAYQVKEVVGFESICEGDFFKWYQHINFTTKAKGVDDHGITNLFFAEVISSKKGQLEELAPSCLRMLEPSDNGACHGCENNGSGEHTKHPNDTCAYTGGHARVSFYAFGRPAELPPMAYPVDDEDELHRAEEARLRDMFTAYDDGRVFDEYKNAQPVREPVTEAMRQHWLAIGRSLSDDDDDTPLQTM